MTDDPIDCSGLDPLRDDESFGRIVSRITAAAAPELARRRLRESVWWQVAAWRKPVLAVGLTMLLLMIGVTQFTGLFDDPKAEADELTAALGVPDAMTGWIIADTIPTTAQVLFPGEE
jgi:hypothetical protein